MNKEVILYYPYFELEKNRLIQRTNHEFNLKTLSLLCDRVLLPPSHLLDLSLSSLDALKQQFKVFIDNQIFITSIGCNHRNLNEFYFEKKLQSNNWNHLKDIKSKEIIELFSMIDNLRKRDRIKQSFVFYEYLQELILTESEFLDNIFNSFQIKLLEKEIDTILNRNGFLISKNDFDILLDKLIKKNNLLPIQYRVLKDFSNSAYYYAGGLGNDAIIAYSSYFQNIHISSLKMSSKYSPTILYDPNFFCDVLIKLGIIDSKMDILNLSPLNILELRQSYSFKNFILRYNKFSNICQQTIDNHFLRDRITRNIDLKINTYKWAFSFSSFISTLGYVASQNSFTLAIYLLGILESYISNFKFSKKFYAKTIDKVRNRLIERIDPFTGFCLQIERVINNTE